MTAPEERAGGFDANAKGIAVLVVAVIVGLLLLLKAGGGGTTSASSDDKGGVTTTAPLGSTTTTPDATTTTTEASSGDHEPSEVQVLVLNGSGFAGVAGTNSTTIGNKGFKMLTAANANAQIANTVVYYADGYQADAEAVASALGKSSDIVEAMPDTAPGPGADQANVVVVLGKDTPQN